MIRIRTRGRLPHWEEKGSIYFVTFRLFDSLPREVLETYQFERRDILETAARMKRPLTSSEQRRLAHLFSARIERYLDAGLGASYLKHSAVADAVQSALHHFDGERYRLFAWCIMPNHVHTVFQPMASHELSSILHSWKTFTAREAHRILRRSGRFWQREYYDHLIRNEREFYRLIDYVSQNPSRAGLKDWPWVGTSPDLSL